MGCCGYAGLTLLYAGWHQHALQSWHQSRAGAGYTMKQRPLLTSCTPGVQVFEKFLAGDTLQDCYAAVAAVANRWLDMLDTQVRLK